MSILVVDDSEDMRSSLKLLLNAEGFREIVTAGSAREAFRHLGLEQPAAEPPDIDVILMDLRMPGTNGVEATRQIKQHEALRDVPIIMITGSTEDRDLEAAFSAGAIDYLVKPIKIVELLARLRSALVLKQQMDCRKSREQELLQVTRQLQEANRDLEQLSLRDPLTGVANRRCFNLRLGEEWARARRDGTALALILIDVDFFKAFNDSYGHPSGDTTLKEVAGVLGSALKRSGDLLARYGGEEFVVLLPGTGRDGALKLAEVLRSRVESLHIPHPHSPHQVVTISLGVGALIPERASSSDTFVAAVDAALYTAKHEGRNCVQFFGPAPKRDRELASGPASRN